MNNEAYTPIHWQNYPERATPITAENLNHMDNRIKQLSDLMDSSAILPVIDGKICVIIREENNNG